MGNIGNKIYSISKSYGYSQTIDRGKEHFRHIKNIENKISNKKLNLNITNFTISSQRKSLSQRSAKVFSSYPIRDNYFENQITKFRKKIKRILNKFIQFKKNKLNNQIFSKFFKLNIIFCMPEKIFGFLIHANSLRYSKFIVRSRILHSHSTEQTILNIIIYFIFFPPC